LEGEVENFWLMKRLRQILFVLFCAPLLCPAQSTTNLWAFHLADFDCSSSPAVATDGTIYVGNFTGDLFALTPDGKLKWKFKAGAEIKSSPAIADDGTIYFGSRDWKLYAVTPAGTLKWTFTTGGWVDSSPAIATDGTIYFGSWDTNFYALNPDGSLKWKFASDGIIDSSPAVGAEGTIYFGSHDKNFYSLSPEGKMRWKYSTPGQITSSPAIGQDGGLYFTSTDGNLYALKADGTEKWAARMGSATESSPVIGDNDDIYVDGNTTVGGYLFSFGPGGKENWRYPTADVWNDTTPIALANGDVYFASPWVTLIGIHTNGQVAETIKPGGNVANSPAIAGNGTLYFDSGRDLVAVTTTNSALLAKSSWPMFRANPRHTGRVRGN
jgi:outer membrane protein assembly factor BamB